jgi:hypothetical protein
LSATKVPEHRRKFGRSAKNDAGRRRFDELPRGARSLGLWRTRDQLVAPLRQRLGDQVLLVVEEQSRSRRSRSRIPPISRSEPLLARSPNTFSAVQDLNLPSVDEPRAVRRGDQPSRWDRSSVNRDESDRSCS